MQQRKNGYSLLSFYFFVPQNKKYSRYYPHANQEASKQKAPPMKKSEKLFCSEPSERINL
jgi:hypothetical protein